MRYSSPVSNPGWGKFMAYLIDGASTPNTVNSSVARTREYLSRYGHRDATMILIAYRHGLRASEVCDLQWHQVEINSGRLHVRRTRRGTPSVHPIQGDELRAVRRLQREQPPGPHVFASERGGPIAPKSFHTLISRLGERARMAFPIHPHTLRHDCGYALGAQGTTPGPRLLADTGLIRRHAGRHNPRISALASYLKRRAARQDFFV